MRYALIVTAALFAAAPLQAAVVTNFQDNFDARSSSALPSNGTAPTWIYGTQVAGNGYTVATDPIPADANDKAMLALRTAANSTYIITKSTLAASMTQQTVAHLSFDLDQPAKYSDVSNSGVFIGVYGVASNGATTGEAGGVNISGAGALSYATYSGTTRSLISSGQTLTHDAYSHFDFTLKYDAAHAAFVYSLSSTPSGSTTPLSLINNQKISTAFVAGDDLKIQISPQGNNSATYFDNVLITTEPLPEPASGALLLTTLGGLLLHRPRTKKCS
jgi:hypothetical protein